MFIAGLVIAGFFLPMAIKMISAVCTVHSNPYLYTYANGMSDGTAIALAVFFSVMVLVGIGLAIFGWSRRKKQNAADSEIHAAQQNYCTNCHINVAPGSTHCPMCGKPIEK